MKNLSKPGILKFLLLAVLAVSAGLLWKHSSSAAPEEKPLIIAYGDDIAGVVLQKALEDMPVKKADIGLDSINMGDCCGSNAQFALSTGEVDVAVLCPDAVIDLAESGKQYTVLGELVYDGNVLVTRPDSPDTLSVIGYMNGRDEQRVLLEEVFGSRTVTLEPIFASALPFALENKAVDAIMLDASLAIKLNYPTQSISSGEVTTVMIARTEILSDPRLQSLIDAYNRTVEEIANEDVLVEMLCGFLETDNSEEVSAFWKTVTVQFGSLKTGTNEKS